MKPIHILEGSVTFGNQTCPIRPSRSGRLPGGSLLRKRRMQKKRKKFERLIRQQILRLHHEVDRKFIEEVYTTLRLPSWLLYGKQ